MRLAAYSAQKCSKYYAHLSNIYGIMRFIILGVN
jgi:hypothetical protein